MIKNLKSLRTQKGISQQQLANALNVSQQSVNKYENHNVEPDISVLIAMADYFDTSVDYLIGHTAALASATGLELYALSVSEQHIIDSYRKLTADQRLCVETLIQTYDALRAAKNP